MLTVTLKRASELESLLTATALKIVVLENNEVSIFDKAAFADVHAYRGNAGLAMIERLNRKSTAFSVAFSIRKLVSDANARLGINSLLLKRAELAVHIKMLTAITLHPHFLDTHGFNVDEIMGNYRFLGNKLAGPDLIYDEKHIAINYITDNVKTLINKQLIKLKSDLAENMDKVSGINLNNTINIPDDQEEMLRANFLIV